MPSETRAETASSKTFLRRPIMATEAPWLGRNLEAATGGQSYFTFEYIGLERRLQFLGCMYKLLFCFSLSSPKRI